MWHRLGVSRLQARVSPLFLFSRYTAGIVRHLLRSGRICFTLFGVVFVTPPSGRSHPSRPRNRRHGTNRRDGIDGTMLASSNSRMMASSTSVRSARTTRKGPGTLVHEDMPGLDTMHDWYQSDTIASRCSATGNMGGRCSPPGKPNWGLNTKVPRPWQKPPDLRFGRHLGPGSYEAISRPHLTSSPSRAVTARLGPHSGRVGGRPFDEQRLSSAFSSVTLRNLTQSETKQPSKQEGRSTRSRCSAPAPHARSAPASPPHRRLRRTSSSCAPTTVATPCSEARGRRPSRGACTPTTSHGRPPRRTRRCAHSARTGGWNVARVAPTPALARNLAPGTWPYPDPGSDPDLGPAGAGLLQPPLMSSRRRRTGALFVPFLRKSQVKQVDLQP